MRKWQAWMGGGALLALAGAAVLLGTSATTSGQAGTALGLAPPSQQVAMNGDVFTVEITVQNVDNLGAYEVTLPFDRTKLEFIGAADYGFLAQTGRQQSCAGFALPASTVNEWGAVHLGCNTNGLISGNDGKAGPGGSGVLAAVAFKPKGVVDPGLSLVFEGIGTETYYIGAPDPSRPAGAVEGGHTALTRVEVCPRGGDCILEDIPFTEGTGIVAIIDPSAPTPTALPPTPTPQPRPVAPGDFRKTVDAALGTPYARLTPGSGSGATGSATPPTGTVAGQQATRGTASVTGLPAPITQAQLEAGIASGLYPAGSTLGADGIPRGPDGVPLAGYGPGADEPPSPWWMASGLCLVALGALAVGTGAGLKTRGSTRASGQET